MASNLSEDNANADASSPSQSQNILKLKDDGNELYVAKDYVSAIAKYTEAIELDGSNALVWANRAACRLAVKEYEEALADAMKATDLDPTYSKAWARRAAAHEALRQYSESKVMWEKALEALPSGPDLSQTDKRLKTQYEANIKAMNVAIGREGKAATVTSAEFSQLAPGAVEVQKDSGNLPWEVARSMLEDLSTRNDPNSSEWTAGMEGLKELKTQFQENGQQVSVGKLGVIDMFTSAIMRDTRIFRISEEDFLIKFFDQLQLERKQWKAWPGNTDLEVIKREALERLEKEGRETVRLALNIAVRWVSFLPSCDGANILKRPSSSCVCSEWIMSGFLSTRIEPDFEVAIDHLQRALDVINWGREVWKDVPRKERGVIFTTTFKRGIWNMLLSATLQAHVSISTKNASEPKDDLEAKSKERELLENINKHASGILKDLEEDSLDPKEFDGPLDPGFRWSFFDNIRGNAFACTGYYHVQLAEANKADQDKFYLHMLTASKCYYKAAGGFSEDDYNHTWYLSCAFEYMVPIGPPTGLVLEVLEKIRVSEPKSKSLWFREPGMAREDQAKAYERLKVIEDRVKELIRDGKMKTDEKFDFGKVQEGLGRLASS
ncbi:hypothetical protein D9758_015296 [Tetrapyrgos nigripes]|uniref:TPR-like protein n=1 Tax=Tetrapyrgos nigripes TaxID=182062 RepID=A0A8H5FPV5_9AGAR|nr:hypothetical protein D9758_015296 [Tetrapyrgos nigripes]